VTNFCLAEDFEDTMTAGGPLSNANSEDKTKDLLMSELFELKNLWFVFNKKMNSVLTILPSEVLNRYDMVAKTLQTPVFDITRYPSSTTGADGTTTEVSFQQTFDEIVYKMAQYYFSVFQAIFAKDNDSVRPSIADFLSLQDPMMRSRKIIFYYEELHQLIDKKLHYV
jgi:hypothetical protein